MLSDQKKGQMWVWCPSPVPQQPSNAHAFFILQFTFHQDHAERAGEESQQQSLAVLESSKAKLTQMAVSREVRSFQRRLLTAFGNETDSDLLKFNQLKVSDVHLCCFSEPCCRVT